MGSVTAYVGFVPGMGSRHLEMAHYHSGMSYGYCKMAYCHLKISSGSLEISLQVDMDMGSGHLGIAHEAGEPSVFQLMRSE